MTELIVKVENTTMLDELLTAIGMLKGVVEVKAKILHKTGLDRALDDVRSGNLYTVDSIDELINECKP